eukprot:Clim_evm92s11 gene=Clim_evmTU92s11
MGRVSKGKASYYGVRKGRKPGIYRVWADAEAQVKGFTGAVHKKFPSEAEAQAFVYGPTGQHATQAMKSGTKLPSTKSARAKPKPFSRQSGNLEVDSVLSKIKLIPDQDSDRAKPVYLLGRYVAGKGSFLIHKETDAVHIWTDGASSNNQYQDDRRRAGYGVFWNENHPWNTSERLAGPWKVQTNQRAELMAALDAIERASELDRDLVLVTDSNYVIKGMTGEFKSILNSVSAERLARSDQRVEAVVNGDLWLRMFALLKSSKRQISVQHVKGHSGAFGNVEADDLAVKGAAKSQ